MVRLGVNVDHVATLRQARGGTEPDPVVAAGLAELGGADSIIVHLREDRRHVQDRDLYLLKKTLKTRLNLEMAATDELTDIACEVTPFISTLVPERRQEITTEGGLDVIANRKQVEKVITRLRERGILVSLFIDPDIDQICASYDLGADFIEIHTGRYAEAETEKEIEKEFRLIEKAAGFAREKGLRVSAGHGLNYRNTARIVSIPEIEELNIGHSIISRAVITGIERAVRDLKDIIYRAENLRR